MKRILPYLLIITVLFLSLATAVFSACSEELTLPSPNVTIYGNSLSWDKVEDAAGYKVTCILNEYDSYSVLVSDTTYSFSHSEAGDYLYKVASVSKSGAISEYSDTLSYHVGLGTREDPILIRSADELKSIGGGAITLEDKTTAPAYYLQMNDIDLGGVEWTPIGKVSGSSNTFVGCYNGNGYTVSNYKQTTTGAGGITGFFAEVQNGYVVNLNIRNAKITLTKMTSAQDVGVLAGILNGATVENCSIEGEIISKVQNNESKLLCAGLLAGKMKSSSVIRCSSSGNIDVKFGRVYAGGLIGYLNGGNTKDVMMNCYSTASVSGEACTTKLTTPPSAYIGAVFGFIQTAKSITNCYGTGQLKGILPVGTETPSTKLGLGFAGSTYGTTVVSTEVYKSYLENINSCYIDGLTTGATYALGVMRTPAAKATVYVKNTEDMMLSDTYVDWDFVNVWSMDDGEYPVLRQYLLEMPILTVE